MSTVTFHINGKPYSLESPEPSLTLNEFIRYHTSLKGTKRSCAEGGCGACTVGMTWMEGNRTVTRSVNSCLRPVALCNGASITTIEGIGGAKTGYNTLQKTLAQHNGSQCGFCSPGMVMTMWGLLQNNKQPTSLEVEKEYDGNICRCTGYRPILAAMKTFAADHAEHETARSAQNPVVNVLKGSFGDELVEAKERIITDIGHREELPLLPPSTLPTSQVLPRSKQLSYSSGEGSNGLVWVDVSTTQHLQTLLTQYANNSVYLVVGRTGYGVQKYYVTPAFQVYLNIRSIPELNVLTSNTLSITVGAAVTLTDMIHFCKTVKNPNPAAFQMLIAHFERIAHTLVRNVGSVGGNLMLQHNHQTQPDNNFVSDAATVLMGIGAALNVVDSTGKRYDQLSFTQFLQLDMKSKYLVSISIPFGGSNQTFRSYKTALRHVNAHSIVNAAMNCYVDKTTNKVTAPPILVFGGLRGGPVRMRHTEQAMVGADVTDSSTFQHLCSVLQAELQPTVTRKVAYCKQLALSYFYKFFLALQPTLSPQLKTAAQPWLTRPVSTGTQSYQPHPEEYPVGEYIPKLTAIKQTSGEAQYVDDIPTPSGCLHAAFVISTQPNANISSVDATAALAMEGVKAFMDSEAIPDNRNYWESGRRLFAIGNVSFVGQTIGLIVADTQAHADAAAKVVKVTYSNPQSGIYTIEDAIQANSFFSNEYNLDKGDATKAISAAPHKVSGSVSCGPQYHFYMETQTCLVVPQEQGITAFHATQDPPSVQGVLAQVTGLRHSDVEVVVRRCGGGYGGKIDSSQLGGAACAFAAQKMGVPIKMVMDLNTNMQCLGNRHPIRTDYQVGFDDDGKLLGISMQIYCNNGQQPGYLIGILSANVDGCYKCDNWLINGKYCKTNVATNTWCRGPGWTPATLIIEHVMNHVANALSKPIHTIKQANFYKKGDLNPTGDKLNYFDIETIWTQVMTSSTYISRLNAANTFNAQNKWRKRALSIVPVKFSVYWGGREMTAYVSVNADGTVNVNTGGIEIGQGLHTKVAQVVAYNLKCPISEVTIVPFTTTVCNLPSEMTGGSTTSEICCMAAEHATQTINQQLAPVRKLLPKGTWQEIVAKAHTMGINLSHKSQSDPGPDNTCGNARYNSYSVAVSEVELDVLTGETEITRCDILFDCGYSLNPAVDIGQVEGAFTMGLGYYLSEEHVFDPTTGKLVNNGTWEYKPPSALDIPLQLHVGLLKNQPNPVGFMSSKAQGEPPICGSVSAMFAVEEAVKASLQERGALPTGSYPSLNGPATVDKIVGLANLKVSDFNLN